MRLRDSVLGKRVRHFTRFTVVCANNEKKKITKEYYNKKTIRTDKNNIFTTRRKNSISFHRRVLSYQTLKINNIRLLPKGSPFDE